MTTEVGPLNLTAEAATRKVRELAADSANVVLIRHAKQRGRKRSINMMMVLRCLQKGVIIEGPYVALKSGLWRMNFFRQAAGEEMTCAVEIDWPSKLLVVTVFTK